MSYVGEHGLMSDVGEHGLRKGEMFRCPACGREVTPHRGGMESRHAPSPTDMWHVSCPVCHIESKWQRLADLRWIWKAGGQR